jgi:hypothetical protein
MKARGSERKKRRGNKEFDEKIYTSTGELVLTHLDNGPTKISACVHIT